MFTTSHDGAETSNANPLLQAALAYAARGLAVFPVWELNPEGTDCACPTGHPSRRNEDGKNPQRHCKSPAKHPRTAHGFKDASKDPEKIRGWWADSPRAHVAIATGAVSNMDALDVDPRSWGDDTLHDLEKANSAIPLTPRAKSGGGGFHSYFRHTDGVAHGKHALGQGIDVPDYVLAPPSGHLSGGVYTWDPSADLADTPLAPMPDWVVARLKKTAESKHYMPSGLAVEQGFMGAAFKAAGWLIRPIGLDKAAVRCPWQKLHSGGARGDSSTVVFAPSGESRRGGFNCKHSHCVNRTQEEVRDALPAAAKARACEQPGLAKGWDARQSDDVPWPEDGDEGGTQRDSVTSVTENGAATSSEGLSSFRSFMSSPDWPRRVAAEAFHGLAGDVVRTIEPHSEADPMALLTTFLVAFGNLIGRGPHFRAEGARHYTNLFGALIGATSKGRKGSSLSSVRCSLDTLDHDWANKNYVSGLSSGEGLIWRVRDAIFDPKDGEITDNGVTDKRLLIVEEEFASTLRVMGRDGNTLSPVVRKAWDDGTLQVLTKNSPAKATGAHVSFLGHITRDEARRYLDRTEIGNGFANRFLWVCVKRSKILPEGGELHTVDWTPLLRRLTEAVTFTKGVGEMKRDEGAREVWHAVYADLSEGKPGMLGAVLGRAEAQVMRLAMLYALLDSASSLCRTPLCCIRREHLLAALALWDYCEASARYIFGDALGDPVADELLAALRAAAPAGLTRTNIRDLFGRNRGAGEIGNALRLLLERRLASCSSETTGGRPSERWVASPLGYDINDGNDQSPHGGGYLGLAKAKCPARDPGEDDDAPNDEDREPISA